MDKKIKVLIVEDEGVVALGLRAQVEELGHQVVAICTNSDCFWESLEKARPDVIFMDIILNDTVTGLDIVRKLRKTDKIPVVFISANLTAAIAREIDDMVAAVHFSKPFIEHYLHSYFKNFPKKLSK